MGEPSLSMTVIASVRLSHAEYEPFHVLHPLTTPVVAMPNAQGGLLRVFPFVYLPGAGL